MYLCVFSSVFHSSLVSKKLEYIYTHTHTPSSLSTKQKTRLLGLFFLLFTYINYIDITRHHNHANIIHFCSVNECFYEYYYVKLNIILHTYYIKYSFKWIRRKYNLYTSYISINSEYNSSDCIAFREYNNINKLIY